MSSREHPLPQRFRYLILDSAVPPVHIPQPSAYRETRRLLADSTRDTLSWGTQPDVTCAGARRFQASWAADDVRLRELRHIEGRSRLEGGR